MLAGVAPINLAASPSMRISEVIGCARPVQLTSRRRLVDRRAIKMEKCGSCATSGTAGGLNTGVGACSRCEVALRWGAWLASVSVAKPPAAAGVDSAKTSSRFMACSPDQDFFL